MAEQAVQPACCGGTGRIPRADWWVRGGSREPDYERDPIVKTAICPGCYRPKRLTTIEMGKPGARYTLFDGGPKYDVHLAGEAANGGTGPILCGLDRHARDPETGKGLYGFSVGGGVSGGPGYPQSHDPCSSCAALIAGRPVGGCHAALFAAAVPVADQPCPCWTNTHALGHDGHCCFVHGDRKVDNGFRIDAEICHVDAARTLASKGTTRA